MLTGPNGAGKTNLLEAMSFLSPGRGLRNARLSDIDRRDAGAGGRDGGPGPGWAVAATIATGRGPLVIGTGRMASGQDGTAGERRTVRIDGEPARGQAALAAVELALTELGAEIERGVATTRAFEAYEQPIHA